MKNKFVCVYAGSLQPTLRLDAIIESIEDLPDDVVVAVAGTGGRFEEYKALAGKSLKVVFLDG